MDLEEAKRLKRFIKEKRRTKWEITYNNNDDFLKDLETILQALKDSISKKKIEDKIEELVKEANYRTENNLDGRVHFREEPCDYQIQVLQELLEDK